MGEFYQHIKRVTRDGLFSKDRWKSIWLLNTGQLSHLADVSYYQQRALPDLFISELDSVKRTGHCRDLVDVPKIPPPDGLRVKLGASWQYSEIEVSGDPGVDYRFSFAREGRTTGMVEATVPAGEPSRLVTFHVAVPLRSVEKGYDEIKILTPRNQYSALGHIQGVDTFAATGMKSP